MEYLIPSFLAGILTVLAPCVLTLLPVILGGTLGERSKWRPLIVAASLGISVIVFTLILKTTTAFITIPDTFWRYLSGGLIFFFGITILFPELWNVISFKLKLHKSDELLAKSGKEKGLKGAVLLGASLGPVFTTCSPTYALILAIVLPQNYAIGVLNLIIYTIGLLIPLLIIGYGGQTLSSKFKFAANPKGWFKRTLGILLILTGFVIITGFDKTIETAILNAGYLGPIEIEQNLLKDVR